MTMDQQGSRRVGDRVEGLLAELRPFAGLTRQFERTIGDEIQAVLDDPALTVQIGLHVLRLGGWSIGIGVGGVDEPLPASTRAASGEAFVLARAAVERSKSRLRPVPLAVEAEDPVRAREAEAVLTLLGSIVTRRTEAGWAVIDAFASTSQPTQDAVAARLGITQQAVSQRLRTAMWAEELAVRPVAARLLVEGER
jgi:hypothetical protein